MNKALYGIIVVERFSMYIHIGGEYAISEYLIVGIFDMENITRKQKDMIHFLSVLEKDDKVEYVSDEIPRSVVLTVEKAYFSPLSVQTLKKRIKEPS